MTGNKPDKPDDWILTVRRGLIGLSLIRLLLSIVFWFVVWAALAIGLVVFVLDSS